MKNCECRFESEIEIIQMLNNYKKNKGEKDYENETNQKITVINLLYDADCGYGIIYKRL